MCLKLRGFSKGAGANPVTNVTRYVMITNLCPECYSGDLDQELPGDGRWIIEWEPVQCNTGYTPFVYSFQGSNGYFMKFQVRLFLFFFFFEKKRERESKREREGNGKKKKLTHLLRSLDSPPFSHPPPLPQVANHRVPVRAVWWGARGQWFPMERTADNYFSLSSPDGQGFEMPARVAIRSVFNDTVYDTVALSRPSGRVKGTVQFPYRPEVPRVPGAARFDGQGALPPTLGGSVSGAPQGSGNVSSASSAISPVSAPLAEPLPTEAPPGTKAPAATPAAPASTPASSPAAPAPSPSVAWPWGKLGWPKGWGSKAATAESDRGGAPSSSSSSFFSRGSFWSGPAGPGFDPQGADSASAEANSGLSPLDACSVAVETPNQCGGKGGWCRGPQCSDAVWPGACCLQPGARCVRYDAHYWECRMNPFPSERSDGEL